MRLTAVRVIFLGGGCLVCGILFLLSLRHVSGVTLAAALLSCGAVRVGVGLTAIPGVIPLFVDEALIGGGGTASGARA